MMLREMFLEGGWWMYPIALLSCAMVPMAIVLVSMGVASKEKNALLFAIILFVGGLAPAMLGGLGQAMSMRGAEEAIAHVDPADAATIRAAATAESMNVTLLGFTGAVIPVFCAFVLLGLGLGRLPRFEEQPR